MTIGLVTYYGAIGLDRLYTSIRNLRYPRDRYSLLVVDNGPDRAAQRWFAAHAPEVRVIVPGRNTGYAGGGALAMQEGIAAGVDYVAILTQDTELDPAWLQELVKVAESYPAAGAVQPKILRPDGHGRLVMNSWGNELHFLGVGYCGGDGAPNRPLDIRPIASASGAGAIYRASALKAVGALDPIFFMYHEDSDLSWRLRLAGYEILLAPQAVMTHHYEFKRSTDKFYYMERNRLINLVTHYRLRTLLLIAPAFAFLEALTVSYAALNGWLRKRLGVYGFFFTPAVWVYLRRKRRQVQSVRRITDRALARHLTGRIDAPPLDGVVLRWLVNPLLQAYWRTTRRIIAW